MRKKMGKSVSVSVLNNKNDSLHYLKMIWLFLRPEQKYLFLNMNVKKLKKKKKSQLMVKK